MRRTAESLPTRDRRFPSLRRLLFGVALAAMPILARPPTDLSVEPGPSVISTEEKAIEPDPAHGAEHAVILLEETDCVEDALRPSRTSYHLRAKILSSEGRGLANVEVPYIARDGRLKRWWARTLLPDGTVRELKEEELDHQSMMKTAWGEVRALKGALPAVVPGCVIDYGYVLEEASVVPFRPVELQREWFVRELRYRWKPAKSLPASFRVRRTEGKDVRVTKGTGEILVVGRNLPPVAEEPFMPPDQDVRASAVFYYLSPNADDDFWNMEAKRIERRVRFHIGNLDRFRTSMGAMSLPAEADLKARVRAAYEWIAAHVQNTSLRSSEEMEGLDEDDDEEEETWNVRQVLLDRKGEGRQLDILFIAAARALGAEANLTLVTDRRQGLWDPQLFSMDQFATSLVAVRAPGEPEKSAVFADPGSGLPYEEVPWWAAGSTGFMATKDGARSVLPLASKAIRNVSDTRVEVRFSEDNESFLIQWSRVGTGQQGLDERRTLRSLPGPEREERLDQICGASGSIEVRKAAAPDLDDPIAPYKVECGTERPGTNLGEEVDTYHFGIGGPWIEGVPELTAPTRVHPIIFPYQQVEFLTASVTAPGGFEPTEAPPVTQIGAPYATYALSVAKTDTGYVVTRSLTWKALLIAASQYEDLRKFLADVRKADRTTLEFRRAGKPR